MFKSSLEVFYETCVGMLGREKNENCGRYYIIYNGLGALPVGAWVAFWLCCARITPVVLKKLYGMPRSNPGRMYARQMAPPLCYHTSPTV